MASVAERCDVIVDFTGLQGKTFYIENRLEQEDGRGPTGDVLSPGQGTKLLPDTLPAARVTRTFRFERNNGQWAVNGKFATCEDIRFAIKRNSVEK